MRASRSSHINGTRVLGVRRSRFPHEHPNDQGIGLLVSMPMKDKITEKARQYGMSKAALVRSMLECVDDGNLWEHILGPPNES